MLRSFLWKGTENEKSFLPVSWTKVCVPKEEGARCEKVGRLEPCIFAQTVLGNGPGK